ncbi:MAG: hypothetical protein GY765_19900 [bacterium]|nr:hypothetical protein [bacterium]
MFYKNIILDYTSGTRNVVAFNYRQMSILPDGTDCEKMRFDDMMRSRKELDLWDWALPRISQYHGYGFEAVALRLKEIENHTPEKKVAVEMLTVYKYPDRESRVLKKIPPGTAYSTCYPLLLARYPIRVRWLKIEIPGGGMGWILQEGNDK